MMLISETNLIRKEFLESHMIHFLGVRVDNISKENALGIMHGFLDDKNDAVCRKVFFTNVHTIHLARKDKKFRDIINNADLCLPDGSGLKIAGKVYSNPIKDNLNGTDFIPIILKIAQEKGFRIYLLGALDEILKKCASKIEEIYPHITITGMHSGFFDSSKLPLIIEDINKSASDILLVAMGSPLQEIFIDYAAKHLNNIVCIAVGGLFDFISGNKRRAPVIIRKLGLEWLFRFFHDPKSKWDRIFVEIPSFLFMIIISRIFPQLKSSSIKTKLSYR